MIDTIITKTGKPAILLEPKDLRIGNILLFENRLVHVTTLSMDIDDEYEETIGFCDFGKDTNEICDWNRALCDRLEPVPLSPEILEKLGFEKVTDIETGEEQINGYNIYSSFKHYWFDVFLNDKNHCCVHYLKVAVFKHPQFLHEFQNLYFALTGEEITFSYD